MRTTAVVLWAGLALTVWPALGLAQELRFQNATVALNSSGSLSGGSQIQPGGRVTITNTSVRDTLRFVYDVPGFAIIGAPEWLSSERYDIEAERNLEDTLRPVVLYAPDYSLHDIYSLLQGSKFAGTALYPEVLRYDARTLGPKFDVPFFIFNGDKDLVTPGVVFGALSERQGQLRSLIRNSNTVWGTTARRNTQLADTFRVLPTFLRESRVAATLEHPSIVPIYGAGEADGLLYLAMRYVEGGDLRAPGQPLLRLHPEGGAQ